MIIGILFCVLGLIHGIFKYSVVRYAARDIYNGGGVPTLDFVLLVPLWLLIGVSSLLNHSHRLPFSGFGFVLYLFLAGGLYGVLCLEYRLGAVERERQLKRIRDEKAAKC